MIVYRRADVWHRDFSLTSLYVTEMTYVVLAAISVGTCVPAENMNKLLKYADSLPPKTKERYKERISLIGNVDPFAINENTKSVESRANVSALPPVGGSDLVSYLVLQTSL